MLNEPRLSPPVPHVSIRRSGYPYTVPHKIRVAWRRMTLGKAGKLLDENCPLIKRDAENAYDLRWCP